MPREKITLTAEFKAAVKEYQKKNNLKSWSATLLHLAAIGYEAETGHAPPGPIAIWGGNRRPKYHCPKCDSLRTKYVGDVPVEGNEGDDDPAAIDDMMYRCRDCGHEFRDHQADMEFAS